MGAAACGRKCYWGCAFDNQLYKGFFPGLFSFDPGSAASTRIDGDQ
jgi:hypothetical protein